MNKLTCCAHPPGICQGLTLSLLGLRHKRSALLSYKLEHWSVFELKAKRWTSASAAAHLQQQQQNYSLAQPRGKRFDKRDSILSAKSKGPFYIFRVSKEKKCSSKTKTKCYVVWWVKENIVNFSLFCILHVLGCTASKMKHFYSNIYLHFKKTQWDKDDISCLYGLHSLLIILCTHIVEMVCCHDFSALSKSKKIT